MGTPTRTAFKLDYALVEDTPTKSKKTVTSPAILGGLDEAREAVMKDLGDAIPQVSLEWFKDKILPPLRSGLNVQVLVDALKANGDITRGGYWSKFTASPAQSELGENVVFKPFENIAKAVGQVASRALRGAQQSVVFKCNPDMVPLSNLRNNTSKPDGFGLFTKHYAYQKEGAIYWEFIVAPGEKKKKDTWDVVNDNNQKIVWSFNHIMREDVCRRFVIGYTIENSNMRLWFCSRSDILVTESFNFRKDHHTLTHFFVSLMYARLGELGFDSTIKPAKDPKARANNQFDIIVRQSGGATSTYRTLRLISNIGAESLRGRGTRVWEAQKLVKGTLQGDTVALKDSWIDDDRDREAVILTKIRASAATLQPKYQDYLTKHLLTVECYGDVYINRCKDQTHTLLRRGSAVPMNLPLFIIERSAPVKTYATVLEEIPGAPIGTSLVRPEEARIPKIVKYGIKSHHRIVFKEVGAQIDSLNSVADIFRALLQVLRGLQAIHQAGWIHRDISCGNILLVNGVAKITDLEYAKELNDESHHIIRTGTAYYMAVEVESHDWEFASDNLMPNNFDEDLNSDDVDRRIDALLDDDSTVDEPFPASRARGEITERPSLPPFRHNPLHDSEGIWWLVLRLTLDRDIIVVISGNVQELIRARNQRHFYRALFENNSARRKAFMTGRHFTAGESNVHPSMLPVARTLETIRATLVETYVAAEQDIAKIDHKVGHKILSKMMDMFTDLLVTYRANDVRLQPIRLPAKKDTPEAPGATAPGPSLDSSQVQAPVTPKRRREEDDSVDTLTTFAPGSELSDSIQGVKRAKQVDEGNDGSSAQAVGRQAGDVIDEAMAGLSSSLLVETPEAAGGRKSLRLTRKKSGHL